MTAVVTGNPWEFTAATEGDAVAGPVYINLIILTSGGTGGVVELLDGAGGLSLTGPIVLAVNDREVLNIQDYARGVYVESLPATCEVHVWVGRGPV